MQRGGVFIGQYAVNVLCCLVKVGRVGDFGEVEVIWEELNRVCVPGGCSGGNLAVVTTVMVEGGANLPTVDSMCGE